MALELRTLHASRQCLHRAVRRQSGVGISFMTSFYIHTLRERKEISQGFAKSAHSWNQGLPYNLPQQGRWDH